MKIKDGESYRKLLLHLIHITESLKAIEVCEAIERGFEAIFPKAEYVKIPIGDGGEGTVDSLVDAARGENYITSCNRAA
ncbi:hypothetical protein ADK17_02090 [Bacillus anthracis]|nr:hypothetical protein ADK17_02090 [Bacillus anthracis]